MPGRECQNRVIVLGGGDDSLFLLKLLEKLGIDIFVLAIQTKSNSSDIRFLTAYLEGMPFNYEIVEVSATRDDYAILFKEKIGRPSNDPVQWVHNYWADYLVSEKKCQFVVDGQFADTLLFANPHNQVLMAWSNYIIRVVCRNNHTKIRSKYQEYKAFIN